VPCSVHRCLSQVMSSELIQLLITLRTDHIGVARRKTPRHPVPATMLIIGRVQFILLTGSAA